ncbi:MAG: NAD(P)/FAD-dependent oxidoreductase, partial [Spirochaetes bacterium]|nr:NAD(P)/FAD-dependent oxidoreductase [Spirochaetota bacterium]
MNLEHKKDIYDTIIIGSGLGGLGAGAYLASNKKDVLLLEKHNVPGGSASSFIRGRFEFEVALHEMDNFGSKDKPGTIYRFFKEIGILNEIEVLRAPEIYHSIFIEDGFEVSMPFGVEPYKQKLKALFPKDEKGVDEFFEICQKILEGYVYFIRNKGKVPNETMLELHPWFVRILGLTLEELLNKFFTDPKIKGIIAQLWPYFGLPPDKMNAQLFVLGLISYLEFGGVYFKGTSHTFSSAMVNRIKKQGGQIKYNSEVTQIIYRDEKIQGIRLSNGEEFLSKTVISNANPTVTNLKLLPPEIVDKKFKRKILAQSPSPGIFSINIGLNIPHEELGITSYEVFLNSSYDFNKDFDDMFKLVAPRSLCISCNNLIDAECSPPGTTVLNLVTLQMGEIWKDIDPKEYFRIKDKIADEIISLVEKHLIPNLRAHIEVCEISTPLTIYRYTSNLDGTVYGNLQNVIGSPAFRLTSKGAVPGLFQVGAYANIGGWYSATLIGGRMAGRMV